MALFKVKKVSIKSELGKRIIATGLPSFSATGNIRGMRKLYWSDYCKPVRVGSFIYNCQLHPDLYDQA